MHVELTFLLLSCLYLCKLLPVLLEQGGWGRYKQIKDDNEDGNPLRVSSLKSAPSDWF